MSDFFVKCAVIGAAAAASVALCYLTSCQRSRGTNKNLRFIFDLYQPQNEANHNKFDQLVKEIGNIKIDKGPTVSSCADL